MSMQTTTFLTFKIHVNLAGKGLLSVRLRDWELSGLQIDIEQNRNE